MTTILAVATLVATVAAPRAGAAPDASPASAGNGYLLMIHATFEPRSHPVVDGTSSGDVRFDQGVTGITYASGAVAATRDGDAVVFHAIPYLTSTVEPVVVEAPVLEIQALGSDRRLLVEPNRPPGGEGACRFETSWYGHEGPVEACSAYRVAVSEFGGLDVVSVRLHFRDSIGPRTEVHHLGAHFLLHMAIEDLPVDLADVDRSTDMATPFVIESAVDPQ